MDQTPFTFAGQCHDEVTFTFDNTDKKLYVSSNFLSLVSPVFRTMFTSDFIEKSTGVVEMKDKEYENVLDFLLVLHPCDRKPITETNVYSVFQLADQYQIDSVIKRCKAALERILRNNFKLIVDDAYNNNKKTELQKTEAAYSCIIVLSTALLYSCKGLKDMALDIISRFGSKVFLNKTLLMTDGELYDENIYKLSGDYLLKHVVGFVPKRTEFVGFFGTKSWVSDMTNVVLKRKACRDAFKELPDDIKTTILQSRLENIEDNKICANEKYMY